MLKKLDGKNYNEIGSEFWLEDQNGGFCDSGQAYVLSGRTAIDLILQDMMVVHSPMTSVYMPAWCCDSMLQPFLERGVDIDFYDVSYECDHLTYHIDLDSHPDILYVTNYFGYSNTLDVGAIRLFKSRGCKILYDRTHSLFLQDDDILKLADYTFASIRKWMGVLCGASLSKDGGEIDMCHLQDYPYLQDKIDAMRLKADYINGCGEVDKQSFLDLYASFGHHLVGDYRNYKMDDQSKHLWLCADKDGIKNKRRANAATLQSGLQEVTQITQMFSMQDGDTPLFVPVLLHNKEERDALRRHLTANAVYCPIHWPKPSSIRETMAVNSLYDRELSLICDQRYGLNEMQRMIEIIKEYYH